MFNVYPPVFPVKKFTTAYPLNYNAGRADVSKGQTLGNAAAKPVRVRHGAACRAARRRRGANRAVLSTMSLAGVPVGPLSSAGVGVSSTALAALGVPECTSAA